MKKEKLQEIPQPHLTWLDGKEGGEPANLRCADLGNANLRRADLKNANLLGADLGNANLLGANLEDANLLGANLRGANLEDANLIGANLIGANLMDANLTGANLECANLRGADLGGADLLNAKNIMSFQAGNSNRVCYAVKHDNCVMFSIGCFWGSTEEAIKKIREDKKYGEGHHYEKLVRIYTEILEQNTNSGTLF